MKYSKFKKYLLYFMVLKSADCPCKCLLGVIRTIGGIETYTRSHQIFQAAIRTIRSHPRRSAAIRSDPAASEPLFGVRWGYAQEPECAQTPVPCIRTDPNRSEPIRTDPNRSQPIPTDPNRPQPTPTNPNWPPVSLLAPPLSGVAEIPVLWVQLLF